MKTYTCDICGKLFGHNVSMAVTYSSYKKSDFMFDSGFYQQNKENADICPECYNKIAEAQEEAIRKIKTTSEKSRSI